MSETHRAQSILIVDDDPDIRESLHDMLVHEGYRVRPVGTGAAAIMTIGGSSLPFNGDILEFIIVSVQWSTAERNAVEAVANAYASLY